MGNYQDFLKAAPQPLRDPDPEQPKRLHTFGNPFKLDKKVDPTQLPNPETCQNDSLPVQNHKIAEGIRCFKK